LGALQRQGALRDLPRARVSVSALHRRSTTTRGGEGGRLENRSRARSSPGEISPSSRTSPA
jgi:hypothetical protein